MADQEVKLLRTWSSPFALRAVWALELKGIQFESSLEDLSNKSSSLLRYNPVHKKVPVLIHNGRAVAESLVIVEYIDEAWPTKTPLLLCDPYERTVARFWAKFGDDKVIPSIWSLLTKFGEEQEAAVAPAIDNLKLLEAQLNGKTFFGGATIGYLDIALGWLVNLVPILEEITGLKVIDGESFPLMAAWMKKFSELSAIKETWPPRDRLVEKFQLVRETFRCERETKK